MASLAVNGADLMSNMSLQVEIRFSRAFRFRILVGGALLALATKVLGCALVKTTLS